MLASIWFLGGVTIAFLGLIGIYIAKIYIETKQRPSTIIKAIYASTNPETAHTPRNSSIPGVSDYH